jgi:3-hydroxybutyryl-CoA dehydrogenase
MLDWGTPIGPCGLMDRVGLDVVRDIELVYHRATGDPSDQPPRLLLDMIAVGKLGEKSGEGFYRYPNPVYRDPGWLTAGSR